MIQQTLSIIKPDGVLKNIIGKIYSRFESENLKIIAAKMKNISIQEAHNFYVSHKENFFFSDLIKFICSGPSMIQVLEGEDAITKNREIMGSTNPMGAKKGSIRFDFGTSIEKNIIHGSDSMDSALYEIGCFFSTREIFGKR